MAELIFLPISDKIESGVCLAYDAACGTGGMLLDVETEIEELEGIMNEEGGEA